MRLFVDTSQKEKTLNILSYLKKVFPLFLLTGRWFLGPTPLRCAGPGTICNV
jgi:hypothetical protein